MFALINGSRQIRRCGPFVIRVRHNQQNIYFVAVVSLRNSQRRLRRRKARMREAQKEG
jgi:hypothetical protein